MKIHTVLLSAGLFLALGAVPAFAQSSAEIQQRKDNQQERIANGVKSGQRSEEHTSELQSP